MCGRLRLFTFAPMRAWCHGSRILASHLRRGSIDLLHNKYNTLLLLFLLSFINFAHTHRNICQHTKHPYDIPFIHRSSFRRSQKTTPLILPSDKNLIARFVQFTSCGEEKDMHSADPSSDRGLRVRFARALRLSFPMQSVVAALALSPPEPPLRRLRG